MLNKLNSIVPVLIWYLAESVLVAAISWTLWHFLLVGRITFLGNFDPMFHEWIIFIYIIKLMFNNIFAVASIAGDSIYDNQEINNNNAI